MHQKESISKIKTEITGTARDRKSPGRYFVFQCKVDTVRLCFGVKNNTQIW